jgi:hypothetical protein
VAGNLAWSRQEIKQVGGMFTPTGATTRMEIARVRVGRIGATVPVHARKSQQRDGVDAPLLNGIGVP